MQRAQIFISYRRDDAAGYARAVYDELARHFGAARVFIDVDDIGAGQKFDEVIDSAVGESEVLLVLIGKRWLGEREGQPSRIGDPGDFVRLEVTAGLAKGMRVIPLLLDGAAMPSEAQLPAVLRPLARRNALEIDNARFAADIERLVAALRATLDEPAAVPQPAPPKRALWWGLAGAVLVAGALATLRPPRSDSPPPTGTARPEINGTWQAEVDYDWPNAHHVERFEFAGDASDLHGSASFLRVPRGIVEGVVDGGPEPGGLRFATRTREAAGAGAGAGSEETVHRYRGRLVGDEIRFVMQTEGGSSPHVPVEFVARRAPVAASQAGR